MLGPLLFLLYVNDITDGLQSTLEIFADDSKLYRIIKYSHDVDTLQQDLNYISSWSKLWLLNFNTAKCSVMHLGKNTNATYTLYDLATNSYTPIYHRAKRSRNMDHVNHGFYYALSQSSQQGESGLGRNFKYMSKDSLMIL